jgi:hypothetical protein
VGVLLFCALAAQQQGAQAREAQEEGTNYAPITHNQYKSINRPKNCKTFAQKTPACLEFRVYAGQTGLIRLKAELRTGGTPYGQPRAAGASLVGCARHTLRRPEDGPTLRVRSTHRNVVSEGRYSVRRRRSQPTRTIPMVPRSTAPGAGTT